MLGLSDFHRNSNLQQSRSQIIFKGGEAGVSTLKAVVMAGGEGSRLRPITVNLPKPLVPVGNRPIMEHIIELLKRHGVTDVVTTLHYLADEIQNHFGDGHGFGVNITHSIEDTPLGTAGSVKQAEVLLKDDTFVIISGDALTDCDLTKALEFHREKGSVATLILYRVPDPSEFGIVITKEDGRIERFLEKPGWEEVFSDTVNTGIYILEPEILDLMKPRKNYDWSKDIFPKLLADDAPMFGYVMDEYWCDVGNLQQYREAQEHLLDGKTTLSVPGELVGPGIWIGENTMIDDQAELVAPVCIGSNCRIKRGATVGPGSVVGDSTLVQAGAHIENSVVWDRCYVGIDSEIRGGIVGSRVTLKRDTKVGEESVIGDRCLIDVGSTIRPKVKVWPDKTIERGSTLTMSLVVGNRWRGALFRDLGVAGLSNIEITPDFATRLGMAFGSLLPEGTRVAVTRDSSRSSRMIKRSVMGSLLSAGCQVIDLHGEPVPIFRHYLRTNPVEAGINIRKLPGNTQLTLIEFLDENGNYLSRNLEKKVEAAFFKEDFHRADPESLGMIEEAGRLREDYTKRFLDLLPDLRSERRPRIVVDYAYSSVSPMFPSILAMAGIDAISLNSFNDARSAPRRVEEIDRHMDNLSTIVASVGYDLGVLVTNEGEHLHIVDNEGLKIEGTSLLAGMCVLVARTRPKPKLGLGITAPKRLEEFLMDEGAKIERCKTGTRDLMELAASGNVDFAGSQNGGFIFPRLHSGFDAMFALVNLIKMLQLVELRASELVRELPEFHSAYDLVTCPWEAKGKVMRRLSEGVPEGRKVELTEGIKYYDEDSWILMRPDSFEPAFHLFAESESIPHSRQLVEEFASKIRSIMEEQ